MGKIHPADGLINRLLKQNARPASADSADTTTPAGDRGSNPSATVVRSHGAEGRLESQLLQLYRANRAGKHKES